MTPAHGTACPAGAFRVVLACFFIAGWAVGPVTAGEPKEYAYVLVQGRIADPLDRWPLSGATLQLSSTEGTYETVTDAKGVFVFEHLPVGSYSMRVTTQDGRKISSIEDPGRTVLNRADFNIRLGGGEGKVIDLIAREDQVEISVRQPSARTRRIWKQLAIFLGGAAVLAAAH